MNNAPDMLDPLPRFEDEREWEDLQRAHDALAQQLKALREENGVLRADKATLINACRLIATHSTRVPAPLMAKTALMAVRADDECQRAIERLNAEGPEVMP